MNIEKLKPWNWFKHEDNSTGQIPVSRNAANNEGSFNAQSLSVPQTQAAGSLMRLYNEMDRLFDEVWQMFGMPRGARLAGPLAGTGSNFFENANLGDYRANLDISCSEKEYEVSIDLPGVSKDDIQIDLIDNTLIIKGHKEDSRESKDKQYYRVERSVGYFQRTLSLPEDVDKESISANIKNGLLKINIPRNPLSHEGAKRITISS